MSNEKISKVYIGGFVFDIEFCSELLENQNLSGQINFHKDIIKLSSVLNKQRQQESLLHEMIHAADRACLDKDNGLTELQVYSISQILFMAMIDERNKPVWDFIFNSKLFGR